MGRGGKSSLIQALALGLVSCMLLGYYFVGYQLSTRAQALGQGRRRHLLDSSSSINELTGFSRKTNTCNVQTFRAFDPPTCLGQYNHPFSGCLSDSYEAGVFKQLRVGQPVADLRCGFVDAASQRWLASVAGRYLHCSYVFYVISFSYGDLQSTEGIRGNQEGVCFVGFVDEAAKKGLAGFNGTHFQRWKIETVDPTLLADTPARASKLLRLLAFRMFPAARYSMFVDYKVRIPAEPLGIFSAVGASSLPFVIVTAKHPWRGHDVFSEILKVLDLFQVRRLSEAERNPHLRNGIRGRDFEDLFRQYVFFLRSGYPMHHTGMMEAALLIWDHSNSCTAALACLWHNQAAHYSMRLQFHFNYVVSMLGLTEQVLFLEPFRYGFKVGANFTLVPTGWPAFGALRRDSAW